MCFQKEMIACFNTYVSFRRSSFREMATPPEKAFFVADQTFLSLEKRFGTVRIAAYR